LRGFGLDRKPTEFAWLGIALALGVRGFGHFIITHHWSKGVSHYDLAAFRNTVGIERYLFLISPILLSPLFEETMYRGFIYKAFRNSYPLWASMLLVVAWTANTHWGQYSVSWVAAFDISVLTMVQCYLREKSDSLWDCILCHLAFNTSLLFTGHVFR
jgi:membrane protease YdiL (CAAX protease family)